MKILKWTLGVFMAFCLMVGGLVGTTFAIASAGMGACAPLASSDGSQLQGQPAKDYLALFPSRQEEILNIVEIAYRAGMERETPVAERAVWTVIATGIQESNLTNHTGGDRDSAGYLQQRPSQGWGTYEEVRDPYKATNTFYDRLEKKFTETEIQTLPMKEMAIAVQIPDIAAYGRWNWDKTAAELVAMVATPGLEESCNASPGGWQLPLEPDSYCVTSKYGMRHDDTSPTGVKMHNGTDMACNGGDPIFAVADGVVKIAGSNGGYGINVKIEHENGVTTSYGHMIAGSIPPGVIEGAPVKRGQTLGNVGNTGRSYDAHLHFEITVDGEHVDPEVYMKQIGIPLR